MKIEGKRMCGFPVMATVDEATQTVYVANDDEANLSIFRSNY